MRFIRTLMSRKGKPLDVSQLEPAIKNICKRYRLELFYVFGSYATGKPGPLSDVDVAYFPSKDIDVIQLLIDLQKIFAEEAMDLIDLRKAPPALVHRVLKGRCLYAKNLRTKIQFETHAECTYYDTAPLRRLYFQKMLERIKHGTYGY
ncbi:MAG: nucleotidyltransferase domain-containing protein [Nanoarchaeota archaeon]|nr:nucleotidyltransferase domain-containing protein [Nanoarchaeota archaeon]